MNHTKPNVKVQLVHDSKTINGYLLGVYETNNTSYAAVIEDNTHDMFIYECIIKDNTIDFLAVVEEDIGDIVDYFQKQLKTTSSSTK